MNSDLTYRVSVVVGHAAGHILPLALANLTAYCSATGLDPTQIPDSVIVDQFKCAADDYELSTRAKIWRTDG